MPHYKYYFEWECKSNKHYEIGEGLSNTRKEALNEAKHLAGISLEIGIPSDQNSQRIHISGGTHKPFDGPCLWTLTQHKRIGQIDYPIEEYTYTTEDMGYELKVKVRTIPERTLE